MPGSIFPPGRDVRVLLEIIAHRDSPRTDGYSRGPAPPGIVFIPINSETGEKAVIRARESGDAHGFLFIVFSEAHPGHPVSAFYYHHPTDLRQQCGFVGGANQCPIACADGF